MIKQEKANINQILVAATTKEAFLIGMPVHVTVRNSLFSYLYWQSTRGTFAGNLVVVTGHAMRLPFVRYVVGICKALVTFEAGEMLHVP